MAMLARSEKHYYPDGNVTIQVSTRCVWQIYAHSNPAMAKVETTLYRLYRSLLARISPRFAELVVTSGAGPSLNDDNPLVLVETTQIRFEVLLDFICGVP